MVDNPYEPSTTLWEKWGASNLTTDQGDSSRNHIMFGSISAFFWKHLAGIAPAAAGWTKLRIEPKFGEVCDHPAAPRPDSRSRVLSSVEGTLDTVAGQVSTSWELAEIDDSSVSATAILRVTVPDGAVGGAEVVLPCVGNATVITELRSGTVVWEHDTFIAASVALAGERFEHGGVVVHVASGEYHFVRSG
jgi:alpha-L-rhamnosidase